MKAFLTGMTGQDASFLAEFLLSKGYEVHGLIRRASTFNTERLNHIYEDPHKLNAKLFLHYGDLSDGSRITNLIYDIKPDEIYHLGAMSQVRVSFDIPEYTGDIVALGTTRLLEAVRHSGVKCKIYNASSSEIFGDSPPPQNELTPFRPRSPYACGKLYSYWMIENYRKAYNMFASNGILGNHETSRRGETFVTRKITMAIARIKQGTQNKLYLGNLEARRDWGYGACYIECMYKILQHNAPDDFVIGTGESHSVREFLEEAFSYADLDWKEYVEIDQRYFRPNEVEHLHLDSTKARRVLGWENKIFFEDLVKIMVDADLENIGLKSLGEGKKIIESRMDKWHTWESCIGKNGN